MDLNRKSIVKGIMLVVVCALLISVAIFQSIMLFGGRSPDVDLSLSEGAYFEGDIEGDGGDGDASLCDAYAAEATEAYGVEDWQRYANVFEKAKSKKCSWALGNDMKTVCGAVERAMADCAGDRPTEKEKVEGCKYMDNLYGKYRCSKVGGGDIY